jgi:pimeloyl-ACP methyl ester carboxylesterase
VPDPFRRCTAKIEGLASPAAAITSAGDSGTGGGRGPGTTQEGGVDLEVLSAAEGQGATPVLFIHGAYAGAWVWEPHFLPFFARHGFGAHAISLRGHGRSGGAERLLNARLRDYVDDVAEVAATLPAPPVVVGHSMGGLVAQHFVHSHPAAALVLLASAPPHGVAGCWLNMLTRHPQLLLQMSMLQMSGAEGAVDLDAVRRGLFSEDTPPEAMLHMLPRMGFESPWAILDLWGLDLPPTFRRHDLPVLVLGGEEDPFVHRQAVEATGWAYRTDAEVFPKMGHAMMLDHHWQAVAARIVGWLAGVLGEGAPDAGRRAA